MRDLKHAAGAWVDEAILLTDLLHNAPRVELFSEAEAKQARQDVVDLLEEEREMALIRSTIYQQDLHRFHARNSINV